MSENRNYFTHEIRTYKTNAIDRYIIHLELYLGLNCFYFPTDFSNYFFYKSFKIIFCNRLYIVFIQNLVSFVPLLIFSTKLHEFFSKFFIDFKIANLIICYVCIECTEYIQEDFIFTYYYDHKFHFSSLTSWQECH